MTIAEIRQKLVEFGEDDRKVALLGKTEARELLEQYFADENILNQADAESENNIADLSDSPNLDTTQDNITVEQMLELGLPPNPKNIGWTKYVLSKLRPDELQDEHPKADGLRRLVELLVGDIISITTKVVQSPTVDNNYHATVRSRICAGNQVVDACADANSKNTPVLFAKHAVATAESRAEGRAYRKLLRLTNIISAEESVKDEDILDMGDKINDTSLKHIDRMCQKFDINVLEWLKSKGITSHPEDIAGSRASELCGELNAFRSLPNQIQESIKGYSADWRK